MKIFKKLTACTVAFAIATGTYGLVSASNYYLKGDTDNSDSVDICDVAHTQQFLTGHVTANGYTAERLDFDNDYIIGAKDRSALSQLIMSSQTPPTLQYTDPSALPVKSNKTYYVYNPSTGSKITSETYTLPTLYDNTGLPKTIIGTDDRIPETNSGLDGVINVQYSNNSNCGTSFVIDSHTLLTAAHVLKNNSSSAVSGLKFKIFNGSSTPSSQTVTPVRYHIPSEYMNYGSSSYDYAIVTVEEDLEDYINFDLGVARPNIETATNKTVYVTGFGGNGANVNPSNVDIKTTGSGSLVSVSWASEHRLYYNVDTINGDSGSPLYVINSDTSKTVIGIHTDGYTSCNSAIRITPDILCFVYNNSNLSAGF